MNRERLISISNSMRGLRHAVLMSSPYPAQPRDDREPIPAGRAWIAAPILRLADEAQGCAETPMRELRLPGFPDIRFLFKDESVHPTGSLKHRLARSLFLYALCSGRLRRGQTAIDASSGSTAISEAWFAQRLSVPFIAVMPRSTAIAKQREVAAHGGRCELVDAAIDPIARARDLAQRHDACYLDQFGLAGSATDWRGNNNIAQSILGQCRERGSGDPNWIVCGAGTGGTSATIGRYLRYSGSAARLCVAEPSGGAFAVGWRKRDPDAHATRPTLIEGIGRSRIEPSFLFDVVDEVIEVDDATSIASALLLEELFGSRYGGSSGTNLAACLQLGARMRERGERGSVVSLLCDRGERYDQTLFDASWLAAHGIDAYPALRGLRSCVQDGHWLLPSPISDQLQSIVE